MLRRPPDVEVVVASGLGSRGNPDWATLDGVSSWAVGVAALALANGDAAAVLKTRKNRFHKEFIYGIPLVNVNLTSQYVLTPHGDGEQTALAAAIRPKTPNRVENKRILSCLYFGSG